MDYRILLSGVWKHCAQKTHLFNCTHPTKEILLTTLLINQPIAEIAVCLRSIIVLSLEVVKLIIVVKVIIVMYASEFLSCLPMFVAQPDM